MQDTEVCPYYDNDEDVCDVGCGYITSHDASMIIKFCSCQYQDCHKYRELADRLSHKQPIPPASKPQVLNRPVAHCDNMPVFGLFCYGITAACYAADKLPMLSLNLHLLAIILMLGAIGQISAGLNSLRSNPLVAIDHISTRLISPKSNPLRAVAFTGLGLFWLSILALDILPRAGYGSVPRPLAMMGYFAMWGMFCLIICQGLEQLTRTCRVVFALTAAFLLMLALAQATGNTAFLHSSAVIGLASSLPGLFLGLRYISSETLHLLQSGMARPGKIRP